MDGLMTYDSTAIGLHNHKNAFTIHRHILPDKLIHSKLHIRHIHYP